MNAIALQKLENERLRAQIADVERAHLLPFVQDRDRALATLAVASETEASLRAKVTAAIGDDKEIAVLDREIASLRSTVASPSLRAQQILSQCGAAAPLDLSSDPGEAAGGCPCDDSAEGLVKQYNSIRDSDERAKFYAAKKHKMFPSK